jgi:hypothetical protein
LFISILCIADLLFSDLCQELKLLEAMTRLTDRRTERFLERDSLSVVPEEGVL